jgi:uncharacterized small protein (TIGR04563 family)
MARTEKQKQSLYFPEDMLREIMAESVRLDRSLSWTVQQAWRLARTQVRDFPAVEPGAVRPHARRVEPERERGEGVALEDRRPSAQVLQFLRGKFDRELTG